MIVMVSNHSSWRAHYLQGRFGGLGQLLSPDGLRGPYPHLPYALDNGAFSAWKNQEPWEEGKFLRALEWAKEATIPPRWIVVPDVVTEPEETFEAWSRWAPIVRQLGIPLALAVQDGMTPEKVRLKASPEVIFVGGSTEWKLKTRAAWADAFPRVHMGRVNGLKDLMICHQLGVESVDGTGFFRGDRKQLDGLVQYLQAFHRPEPIAPMFMPQKNNTPLLPFTYQ